MSLVRLYAAAKSSAVPSIDILIGSSIIYPLWELIYSLRLVRIFAASYSEFLERLCKPYFSDHAGCEIWQELPGEADGRRHWDWEADRVPEMTEASIIRYCTSLVPSAIDAKRTISNIQWESRSARVWRYNFWFSRQDCLMNIIAQERKLRVVVRSSSSSKSNALLSALQSLFSALLGLQDLRVCDARCGAKSKMKLMVWSRDRVSQLSRSPGRAKRQMMDFSVLECDIKDKKRWLREVGEQLRG